MKAPWLTAAAVMATSTAVMVVGPAQAGVRAPKPVQTARGPASADGAKLVRPPVLPVRVWRRSWEAHGPQARPTPSPPPAPATAAPSSVQTAVVAAPDATQTPNGSQAAGGALAAWAASVVTPQEMAAWSKVAWCEMHGDWGAQGTTHSGGLGFANSTWSTSRYGGTAFAPDAGLATPAEQVVVAMRIQPNPPDQSRCGHGW